jgi:hypothetical protein
MTISTPFLPRVTQDLNLEGLPTVNDEKDLKKKPANIGRTREELAPLTRGAAIKGGNLA